MVLALRWQVPGLVPNSLIPRKNSCEGQLPESGSGGSSGPQVRGCRLPGWRAVWEVTEEESGLLEVGMASVAWLEGPVACSLPGQLHSGP